MPAAVARVVLLSCLLLGASSCSRFERSRECNGYARLINHALDEIAADQKRPPTPELYQRIAERYDRLAKDLERVRPKNPDIEQLLNEYRTLYRQTTSSLRHAASLLARPEHGPNLNRERTALESLARQDKSLAQRFETACRGP